MIRVIAKNWQGIVMLNKLFDTELLARDFINQKCLGQWNVTSTVE